MRLVYVSDDNSQHNTLFDAVKQDMVYYSECVRRDVHGKFLYRYTHLIPAIRNYETFRKMTFRDIYDNNCLNTRGGSHNQIKRELHKVRAEFKLEMQKCIAEYRRRRKILNNDKKMYRIAKCKYLEMKDGDKSSERQSFEHIVIDGKIGLVPKEGN